MPAWITSRLVSVLVAVTYLLVVSFAEHKSAKALLGALLVTAIWLVLPLACIWFGDELGEYVGAVPGPAINRRSPGWMVKVGGWVLLLLPVVLWWFTYKY